MAVFDIFDPLRGVTPRFTEEQLNDIIDWFDCTAKPLLSINDGEPINVISIENLIDFLKLKKYRIVSLLQKSIVYISSHFKCFYVYISAFRFHRRYFHYPTYAEIMTEAEALKAGVFRALTKEQVIYMLNKWVLETNLKHELELAFRVRV